MKVQQINGEDWPPSVAEADIYMIYPTSVPKENQFAMGNKLFNQNAGKVKLCNKGC